MKYDYCIIGGGIVGLATALELLRLEPGASLVLLEKEAAPGLHQTGHNSGVIHAGIYYAPGSLKAELCRAGCFATKDFCREHDIPFEVCGKLLVATNAAELARMEALYQRASANGLQVEKLSGEELKAREPHISGIGALFVKETGIVNYRLICEKMAELIRSKDGEIRFSTRVTKIVETAGIVEIGTESETITCVKLVVCAGLQSDRLARLAGLDINHRILPFRGEYYVLPQTHSQIVRHLIYPIPDPELPFLGVHLTRMIDGTVTVGPNAVLGFAREGYPRFSFNFRDTLETLSFSGFWRVAKNNWRSGLEEFRNSAFKSGYLAQCQKYCPSLKLEDLQSYPAGIRAQAVLNDGTLVHDFLFAQTQNMLHVLNAPSPAATSAIPIGKMIAGKIRA